MTDTPSSPTPSPDLSEQSVRRLEKLQALQTAGVQPYPNDFRPDGTANDVIRDWGSVAEVQTERRYRLAGRLMAFRSFGKSTFGQLRDRGGNIQIFADQKTLGEADYAAFKQIDLGDLLGIQGVPFRTRTGELTLRILSFRLMVKCLHPLPEKFHGLQDVDARYRRRYLDLMTSPASREVFLKRARIIDGVRRFFQERDYLEVETPMMHSLVSGAAAKPFITHHNTLHLDLFLRIAPELYLKRLVVGGCERVFEINRNFRNEGISIQHNPEFTMIEFYQAWADYRDLMELTEALFSSLAREVAGGETITYQGTEISLRPPFRRVALEAAVGEALGLGSAQLQDRDGLYRRCLTAGLAPEKDAGRGRLLVSLFEEKVEPTLIQPTFVTDFPTEVSPLSRRNDADPQVTERFELYIYGREIANGFSELNDPFDQKARFEAQVALKAKGDEEAMDYDADYIAALEYGLPPTAGEGIGIDRLVMLLTDQASIRDVILFPQMRPKGNERADTAPGDKTDGG